MSAVKSCTTDLVRVRILCFLINSDLMLPCMIGIFSAPQSYKIYPCSVHKTPPDQRQMILRT